MRKLVATMSLNNWEPEITSLTFPLMKYYAKKIGADFLHINNRKFPNDPIGYERFQLYDYVDKYDWIVQLDADLLLHPDTPDVTCLVDKDTILTSIPDHAGKRFILDDYFHRDGRYISVPGFFTVTSNWMKDFWRLPEDLTSNEAIKRVTPCVHEWRDRYVNGEHLVIDYIWSRNVAKYGLKMEYFQNIFKDPLSPIQDYVMHNSFLPLDHKRQHIKDVVHKHWKLKIGVPPLL